MGADVLKSDKIQKSSNKKGGVVSDAYKLVKGNVNKIVPSQLTKRSSHDLKASRASCYSYLIP